MAHRRSWLFLVLVVLIVTPRPAAPQVAPGWEKVSGPPETASYSGVPDGLQSGGDRQNSYAWSMDVLGDSLYVGTNRDVFVLMVQQVPWGPMLIPNPVPLPTDMRARIYRMSLVDGTWQTVYVAPPLSAQVPLQGPDAGYRMMKTFTAEGQAPVLYVGGSGVGLCRLLAIDGVHPPIEIFRSEVPNQFLSIRAIAEHAGRLFWATEDGDGPALFVSDDPLGEHLATPGVQFERIGLPSEWQQAGGAEIADLISYNGWLYVFFLTKTQDPSQFGFWCARVKKMKGAWQWKLVVGDGATASYPAGLGNPDNGVAVPFRYRNFVYVGMMDAAAFRLLNGITQPSPGPLKVWGDHGMQLWRFDQRDRWERVMPAPELSGLAEEAARGFGNPNNKYLWRFGIVDSRLYVGTFDVGTGMHVLNPPGLPLPVLPNPQGFDLYSTHDGMAWRLESEDGFGDPWNYGARSFATDPATGDLYMGTANPFYGCQVWRRRATRD